MSWPLAAFTLLGLALFAGFWWYERSHPSSKVLALVATLAALAALGRIAFAPIPNVKPTTDIVLLSGYVLGGAPGFAVGAIGALASNIVFGQGPWTPWQMGAWGLCGLLGAGVGVLSGRRMGRWPLALVCLGAGLLYGAILDFSAWVQFSGSHTLGQLVAISGTSLSFNIAHAIGNLVFCLAFGPVFVRALLRYRARFEITWHELAPAGGAAAGAAVALLAALVVVAGSTLGAAPPARASQPQPAEREVVPALAGTHSRSAPVGRASASSLSRGVAYLRRAQNSDGGFGGARNHASNPLFSGWVAIGLRAAGASPSATRRPGRPSLATYLARGAGGIRGTGDLERTILALRAAGANPRRVAGRNLVAALLAKRDRNGSFDGLTNLTAFGVLALRAGGLARTNGTIRGAASFVARQQNGDGGFGYARKGSRSGIDETAAAIQALAAAGRSTSRGPVARAVGFLRRHQNLDGGFGGSAGAASNAQSTAFAVQGFVAARRDPDRISRRGSRTPLAYLRSLTATDGSVRYSRTSRQSPVWVTAQALAALAKRPLPLRR